MLDEFTAAHIVEAISVLCGSYDITLGGGMVRLLGRSLPGPAVCAILPDVGDGILRIVFDPEKPDCYRHAREMLAEWWLAEHGESLCPEPCGKPLPVMVPPLAAV